MKQRVATMVFVLLGFLAIGQSVYFTSQIDINLIDKPTISSAAAVSDVNAAHITEPVTLPAIHTYKTDILTIPKIGIVYDLTPITYSFHSPPPYVTESYGFLGARKYQSNYLS
ncbi:hypothetical protein WMZ97_10140 [Lentibacillus sp. N15]|uniref:hypothetical protein n=1 Tax=Lentibacillus songyuanensis TaxID=3136161 RepID=UPI0031BBA936